MLETSEKVCPSCGAKVGFGAPALTGLSANAGTIIFYSAALGLMVSLFTPKGISFILILSLCAGIVIFVMRKKITG